MDTGEEDEVAADVAPAHGRSRIAIDGDPETAVDPGGSRYNYMHG